MTKVAAFYQFRPVPNPAALRDDIETLCAAQNIYGTVIVAPEGINGTLAGHPAAIATITAALTERFPGLDIKYSQAGDAHFDRLKIKQKPEIVTLGRPEADPLTHPGTPIAPKNWHEILDDPEIILLDIRKAFETQLGTFPRALSTHLESFRAFPDFAASHLDPEKHTRIAMFCTGGIRCEKAAAYLLAHNFKTVLKLQGGILRYLQDIPPAQNRFTGPCFVFDRRKTLGQNLALPGATHKPNVHPNLLDSARISDAE